MTFGMVYAYSEKFVLPISHDEVVHGKGSLLNKMPGDEWLKCANLRAYLGFMWTHPGKKLLFMGQEIGQWREWNHDGTVDWHLLDNPRHRGLQRLVRDLNRLYRAEPGLHGLDTDPQGFEWVVGDDNANSVFAFLRKPIGEGRAAPRRLQHDAGAAPPLPDRRARPGGFWREAPEQRRRDLWRLQHRQRRRLRGRGRSPSHGQSHSLELTLPPLATIVLAPGRRDARNGRRASATLAEAAGLAADTRTRAATCRRSPRDARGDPRRARPAGRQRRGRAATASPACRAREGPPAAARHRRRRRRVPSRSAARRGPTSCASKAAAPSRAASAARRSRHPPPVDAPGYHRLRIGDDRTTTRRRPLPASGRRPRAASAPGASPPRSTRCAGPATAASATSPPSPSSPRRPRPRAPTRSRSARSTRCSRPIRAGEPLLALEPPAPERPARRPRRALRRRPASPKPPRAPGSPTRSPGRGGGADRLARRRRRPGSRSCAALRRARPRLGDRPRLRPLPCRGARRGA
jgi:hypothetical protein